MSTNAARNLSPAELEERKAFLKRLSVDFPKPTSKSDFRSTL